MFDPRLLAQLDQAGAEVRERFADLGINLADPDQRRAVKCTVLVALALTPTQLEGLAATLLED